MNGSVFAAPIENEIQKITLMHASTGAYEICNLVGRSGNVLIVERGKEGTQATAWAAKTRVGAFLTAETATRFVSQSNGEVAFLSNEISLTTVAQPAWSMPITEGLFYPSMVALVVTEGSLITIQPTISMGHLSDNGYFVAEQKMTELTESNTIKRFICSQQKAVSSITASVNIAATAQIMVGKFLFHGFLI
jgi:hypothetical protein